MARKREKFNHEREFVVFKPFTLNNKNLARGEPFDKTQVNTRRLRQLFDQFYVNYPDSSRKVQLDSRQESRENRQENRSDGGPPRSAAFLEEDIVRFAREQEQERKENEDGKGSKEASQSKSDASNEESPQEEQEEVEKKTEVGVKRVARTVINRPSP